MPSPIAATSRRTAWPTIMTRSLASPSGSARRNATSVIDCAASRMSCARRTMTAKPQNRMIGTMIATASRIRYGFASSASIGADIPDVGTEHDIGKRRAAARPGERQQQNHPVDAVGGAPVERLPERPEILLAVVIGRREAGRLQRRRFGGNRAPFVGGPRRRTVGVLLSVLRRGGPASQAASAGFAWPLSRASSSAACEICASRSSIEAAMSRSSSPPVKSKSSASSSSFATSLSRFLVVVGFCAMRPLPCTKWRGQPKHGRLFTRTRGSLCTARIEVRIVVAQPGKGNLHSATCVKV